jgi:hypothetical protein
LLNTDALWLLSKRNIIIWKACFFFWILFLGTLYSVMYFLFYIQCMWVSFKSISTSKAIEIYVWAKNSISNMKIRFCLEFINFLSGCGVVEHYLFNLWCEDRDIWRVQGGNHRWRLHGRQRCPQQKRWKGDMSKIRTIIVS